MRDRCNMAVPRKKDLFILILKLASGCEVGRSAAKRSASTYIASLVVCIHCPSARCVAPLSCQEGSVISPLSDIYLRVGSSKVNEYADINMENA